MPRGVHIGLHLCRWQNAQKQARKWNESGFRPPLCTYRLNWARRTSWGWWDDWDDTVLQTQDSKFEPWRSEAEHATSRPRRLPTILTFTRGWGRNIFFSFKPPRPGTEPWTLAWKAAVLTTTLGPPPQARNKTTIHLLTRQSHWPSIESIRRPGIWPPLGRVSCLLVTSGHGIAVESLTTVTRLVVFRLVNWRRNCRSPEKMSIGDGPGRSRSAYAYAGKETSVQGRINDGPTSVTLVHHWPVFRTASRVRWCIAAVTTGQLWSSVGHGWWDSLSSGQSTCCKPSMTYRPNLTFWHWIKDKAPILHKLLADDYKLRSSSNNPWHYRQYPWSLLLIWLLLI